jgi:hypothetical protein
LDAADADDDGVINLTDALVIVRLLFQGGTALPAPYPGSARTRRRTPSTAPSVLSNAK